VKTWVLFAAVFAFVGCGSSSPSAGGAGGAAGTAGAAGSGGASNDAGLGGSAGAADAAPVYGTPKCQPPASVPDPWEVTFASWDEKWGSTIDNVLFEVFDASGTLLGSGVAPDKNGVVVSIPSGGKPIAGIFTASKAPYLTSRYYVQGGLGGLSAFSGTKIYGTLRSEPDADALVESRFQVPRDPNAALVWVFVGECGLTSIGEHIGRAGATIEFNPPGTNVVYLDADGKPVIGAPATNASGWATAANVPAGEVEMLVTIEGVKLQYKLSFAKNSNERVHVFP